ncbi:unnamed protein product [Prunus armeniaca]|uniref:Uncharacterized protein n=1 Tax=Prunus armeniaca TaxID=36596 RepID=A0A6J5Y411_PRUAR|nr:unnamed protein product [Prunus armeniaca]
MRHSLCFGRLLCLWLMLLLDSSTAATGGFLNTRKVFSEYHNVPVDTHKVFTALVKWGSCRSPSVIHNREVLVRALFVSVLWISAAVQYFLFLFPPSLPPLVPFYRPRRTDRVEPVMASRTAWVGKTRVPF